MTVCYLLSSCILVFLFAVWHSTQLTNALCSHYWREHQPSCLSVKRTHATSWWVLVQTKHLHRLNNEPSAPHVHSQYAASIQTLHLHYGEATAQAVMTRLRTGRPTNHSSIPGRSKGVFSSPERTRPPRRSTKPPTQQAPEVLSPGVKRQSAEVKNEWSDTSNLHMLLWRAQHSFASFRNFIYVLTL